MFERLVSTLDINSAGFRIMCRSGNKPTVPVAPDVFEVGADACDGADAGGPGGCTLVFMADAGNPGLPIIPPRPPPWKSRADGPRALSQFQSG